MSTERDEYIGYLDGTNSWGSTILFSFLGIQNFLAGQFRGSIQILAIKQTGWSQTNPQFRRFQLIGLEIFILFYKIKTQMRIFCS